MRSQQILSLIIGFALGLIIGIVLIGANDDLREDLFGTATDNPSDEQAVEPSAFYLVNFNDARDWLSRATEGDDDEPGEALEEGFTNVLALADATASGDFARAYQDAANSIEEVLATIRNQLLEGDDAENAAFQVCVGIDNDPYSATGPQIYLYVQTPEDAEGQIPDEWQENKLDSPREPTLYWSFECYDPENTEE